jgi:hypothetical protein
MAVIFHRVLALAANEMTFCIPARDCNPMPILSGKYIGDHLFGMPTSLNCGFNEIEKRLST